MRFSAFAPLGLYRLSSEIPLARRIYDSMKAQVGDELSMDVGTRQEAFCYASSLAIARAGKKQREGALQGLVAHVTEQLPNLERIYELVPGHTETTYSRKQNLAVAVRRPLVWTATRIEGALQELIGDGFYAYRPTPSSEATLGPAAIGDQPMNLQRANVARKIIRITQPISVGLGAPQSVTYELFDAPQSATALSAQLPVTGDRFVVEPNIVGIGETVELTFAGTIAGLPKITATFDNPHTNGCLAFTHPYPSWVSTKRHNLVITTPAVAQDPVWRRKIDRAMRRMVRGSSTWAIVQSSDGISTDSFESGVPNTSVLTLDPITF
jgi:hypothetical protein